MHRASLEYHLELLITTSAIVPWIGIKKFRYSTAEKMGVHMTSIIPQKRLITTGIGSGVKYCLVVGLLPATLYYGSTASYARCFKVAVMKENGY
jgi:hypothetical protein